MEESIINVHESWKPLFDKWKTHIQGIFELMDTLPGNVYPPKHQIFRVFEMPVQDIQIFICFQDPYHQPGQANGLAVSVNKDIKIPPSLANMYKELKSEFPERNYEFEHGDLTRWFYEEKMFLFNAALTVRESCPACFMKQWAPFTDDVIRYISQNNQKCVYVLMGNFAIAKKSLISIENQESKVVECVHPSPLSASRGFFGSNVFKQIEEKVGKPVNWNI